MTDGRIDGYTDLQADRQLDFAAHNPWHYGQAYREVKIAKIQWLYSFFFIYNFENDTSFRVSADMNTSCRPPRPYTTPSLVTSAVRLEACSHPVVQIRIKLTMKPVLAVPAGRNQQTIKM